jgi:uncharacterized membrane protein
VFVLDKGRVVTVDHGPAGAALCCSGCDINDRGQVVGGYLDAANAFQGFLLDRGRATTIAVPGDQDTVAVGINNHGQIVGVSRAGRGQPPDGFLLRDGAGGPFTPIDAPGAPWAAATGINDAGTIVGLYEDPDATPGPQPASTPMGRRA